jgi:CDP-glycerol glycerophosphotransferase (TagB/SpsB family)
MEAPNMTGPQSAPPGPTPPPAPSRKSYLMGWAIWLLNLLAPKRPNRAVLYGHPPLNEALLAVFEGLDAHGVECHVIVDDAHSYDLFRDEAQQRGIRLHRRHELGAILSYVTARFVFVTSMFYRSRPVRRQLLVNLWHGAFTKRIDSRPVFEGLRGARTTATSRLGAAFRTVEFDVAPEDVLLIGSPRNDPLLSTTRADSRAALDLPADGLVLLWLPTYRGQGHDRGLPPAPSDRDLELLEPWLAAHNALLLIKHHPVAPPVEPSVHRHVRVVPHVYDGSRQSLAGLMAASDALITDFSSAWADYLLLDRPIWIHWPDFADWADVDNIPLTPIDHWLPGPLTTSPAQLITELSRHFDDDDDAWVERRGWLKAVFHHYCDASSTERLLDALGIAKPS